jgi:hypothetical protein
MAIIKVINLIPIYFVMDKPTVPPPAAEIARKEIADGTAIIESWYDERHERLMYQIRVEPKEGGGSIIFPRRILDRTREGVEALFSDIRKTDTFDQLIEEVR